MNEISIIQRAGAVTCDFEGMRTQLDAYCKEYEGVVFTEDTKTDAKKTVANLRKDQKEWLNRIKDAKAEYMKPWDAFAEKANELARMFDKPICAINEQIDAFEEGRKKEKDERINEIYAEMVVEKDILEYLPLTRVYNEKWLNATYTEKQIKDDILSAKVNVKTGLDTIKNFESDVEEKALEVFKQTLNLPDALKVITDYEANKRVFKEKVENETRAEVIETFTPVDMDEETKDYRYTIFLTKDGKAKLEAFMDSLGIEYVERS